MKIVKEVLSVVAVFTVVFLWMMLVQLIISFIALSYITLKLKVMIPVALGTALVFTLVWELSRIHKKKKYKKLIS